MERKNFETLVLTKDGIDLTTDEKEKFFLFLKEINGASFIYRGVNGKYLRRRYYADAGNIPLLSRLLFLYGDKGKSFCEKLIPDNDINNIERICFKSILNKLKETFTNKESNNNSVNNNMESFFNNNGTVISKLISTNEEEWCNRIESLSEKARRAIKDYYISFLHTIGKAGYGNYSYFLSTTKSKQVAGFFRNDNQENGITIVGWTNDKNIKCTNIANLENSVKECGFPVFDTAFYPKQQEVSYKCGLLPHFIIGYHYNPYVLEIKEMNGIRKIGLPVNQEKFKDYLSKTNFKSYYNVYDCFYWQE